MDIFPISLEKTIFVIFPCKYHRSFYDNEISWQRDFFCRVTEVIWVLKHFANQVSSYLIPTFTGDESPASRHDFFQKLAYRLCMSGVIFSRMVLQRKKYFQWSTSRWVGNVNSLENAITGRLLLKKIAHIMWYTPFGKTRQNSLRRVTFLSPSSVDKTLDLCRRNEVGNIMWPALIVNNDWTGCIIHTSINNI